MFKFILKRIALMLLTLWIIISITFFMMHSVPGNPLAKMAKNLPKQTFENYMKKYGLEKPLLEQYGIFWKNLILKGDLGESILYPGRSVTDTIKKTTPVSGKIGFTSLFIGVAIGVTLGIIAALFRNKWPDYLVIFIAMLGVTIPVFVMGSLLQVIFAAKLKMLPTAGWGQPKHMVMPVIAMCFGPIATYARYMRSNFLEVLNQDYILTAEAKGVSRLGIIFKHVLRNALLPVITILGPQIAGVFTGSFVVERMFSIPGLGYYFVDSVNNRDYPMIIGTTAFYAALFIISQLAVDIVYGLVDPRIRVQGRKA